MVLKNMKKMMLLEIIESIYLKVMKKKLSELTKKKIVMKIAIITIMIMIIMRIMTKIMIIMIIMKKIIIDMKIKKIILVLSKNEIKIEINNIYILILKAVK